MFRLFCSVIPQLAENGPKRMCANVHCIYGSDTKSRTRNYSQYTSPYNTSGPETENAGKQYTTLSKMFKCLSPKYHGTGSKVSIVGLDDTGMAIVYTLLAKGITNNICMIDMNEAILQGEQIDLQSSALFLNNPRIFASKDPADTRDSVVCVVTTGTFKGIDERDEDYIARSAGIVRAIVTPLAKHSPKAIFIVASDPVDILTFATWRITGLPKEQIIGVGTLMDSARFQYLLSVKLGVAPESCSAFIIGEHGQQNSVPVWSNVNVAGVRLVDLNPHIGSDTDLESWDEVFQDAVKIDETVRQLKGTVSWSAGLAVAEICKAIFTNRYTIHPISTYVKGMYSIRDEIFLSLPCVISKAGVTNVVRQTLSEQEATLLRRGAEHIMHRQQIPAKLLN